jgi:cell volume regulation protein A
MGTAHEIILVAGVLCLLAIVAGLISSRIGTPLLLVFIGVGVLAGEDGPGGIQFHDFQTAYLVGSLALAAILFDGGLSTERTMIQQAMWPSLALATVGVAISAGLVGSAVILLFGGSWPEALLLGAATAPTDAAAVSVLLRLSRTALPSRVVAALEIESGLNDPMSVFLTVALVQIIATPDGLGLLAGLLLFAKEMGGGFVIGVAGGYGLLWLFRRLHAETSVFPVMAVGGALATFGAAQVLGASGFLAVYLAGVIVGNHDHPAARPVTSFFGALGWLSQISLFLMLGLLVTPHELPLLTLPAIAVSAILIIVARPAAVMACLLPFGWKVREAAFVSWVGLRGAVPIYLTTIPLLEGVSPGRLLFDVVFVVVILSVAVQGWTISLAASLLRLEPDEV